MDGMLAGVLLFALGYALGGLPTAYVVGRLNGIDIFKIGSGNMGATNVARSLGWGWFVLVTGIDVSKGILAVLVARLVTPADPNGASVIAALAAIAGHNWSVWVRLLTGKLRGGKGAAASAGTWLVLFAPWWLLIVVPALVLIGVVVRSRYMSLGVLVTAVVAVVGAIITILSGQAGVPEVYIVYAVLMALMLLYQFRENIQRLAEGRERKLGERV